MDINMNEANKVRSQVRKFWHYGSGSNYKEITGVYNQVIVQLSFKVNGQVDNQVWSQVNNQVCDQVRIRVREQVRESDGLNG